MSQHHDPVHPDSDHLTAEVLADLELGLLDAASAAHAEQHLAHCADCNALRGDLATLTDALSALPAEPMPDGVWDQLAEAIAAEPVLTPAGAATVVPIETARRRRWGRPGIGVVAGAAGVALIGAIIVSSDFGGGDAATTLSESADVRVHPTASRRLPPTAYAATQSGTRYQEAALDSQVTELVAAAGHRSRPPRRCERPRPASSVPRDVDEHRPRGRRDRRADAGRRRLRAQAMATDPAAAQACLEGYLDVAGMQPLAIDIGVWEGEPAAVIVLPETPTRTWPRSGSSTPTAPDPEDPLFYFATVAR